MNTTMKTALRTTSRSTDELWIWAERSRAAALAAKYPDLLAPGSHGSRSSRHSSRMARGILERFYALFRNPLGSVRPGR